MPRLDQLNAFLKDSNTMKNKDMIKLLDSPSNFDKAIFLINHALEYNWQFQMVIRNAFKKFELTMRLTGNLKTNLMRIKNKIEYENKENNSEDGVMRVKDMIRAKIMIKSLNDFEAIFNHLSVIPDFVVLKIINNLEDMDRENLIIVFMYREGIIGELLLEYKEKQPQYYAHHFIHELEHAKTAS